jgi:hypothetical protein
MPDSNFNVNNKNINNKLIFLGIFENNNILTRTNIILKRNAERYMNESLSEPDKKISSPKIPSMRIVVIDKYKRRFIHV